MEKIIIIAVARARLGDQRNEIKTVCKDGLSLTAFSDKKAAKRSFKAMSKDGRNVVFKDGVILETIEGKSKEEIADAVEDDIKKLKQQLNKVIKVQYTRVLSR